MNQTQLNKFITFSDHHNVGDESDDYTVMEWLGDHERIGLMGFMIFTLISALFSIHVKLHLKMLIVLIYFENN